jgi:hypothetical protein
MPEDSPGISTSAKGDLVAIVYLLTA